MGPALVINPVKPGLHGQAGQQAVLAPVPVRGGEVHCPALVVEALPGVVILLVPGLGHPHPHSRPLVHHGDGQRVELLFTPLEYALH